MTNDIPAYYWNSTNMVDTNGLTIEWPTNWTDSSYYIGTYTNRITYQFGGYADDENPTLTLTNVVSVEMGRSYLFNFTPEQWAIVTNRYKAYLKTNETVKFY
jgi:hypothetical protein